MPLENTTNYSFVKIESRSFTPNYPTDLLTENIPRHQALIASVSASWLPGVKYIELPDTKIMIPGTSPRFELNYLQGVPSLFGSKIDYGKWKFSISHKLNLKLYGKIDYHAAAGGFLYANKVFVPDFNHFNGDQITMASDYLNSFQLLPYYKYSNMASFYGEIHIEYHLNGFLTNLIPLFKRLNWQLVTGANAFYINTNKNYVEVFAGLENILKIMRLDVVWGLGQDNKIMPGLLIGIPIGIITGKRHG
jgi:hypothetical protein